MDTNKKCEFMLDEFLEWLADECQVRGESYVICSETDRFDRFRLIWVQTSWLAWQASRKALCVDLSDLSRCFSPNDSGEWAMWLDDIKKLIEAEGLKVQVSP